MAPIADALLASNPDLRSQFDNKLASDSIFANDPDARLRWLAARLPHRDAFSGVYPIRRVLAGN
ncbi:hypothetical protein ACFS32_04030 [Novosphingobium pokkalii]